MYFIYTYEDTGTSVEPPADPPEVTFTQAQVNEINKKERLRREASEKKLKENELLLATLRNEKNLTEAEKEELHAQLEEIEKDKMSDAEKREHEMKKLKDAYESEKKELADKLAEVQKNHDSLIVTRSIRENALEGPIVALDGTGNQVLAVLQHQTFVNEEGEVIAKNFTYSEDGKDVSEDLPIKEAISKMKSMDAWSNFWKDPSKKGYNSPAEGAPRGPLDTHNMTQKEYRKLRAENKIPWALGKGK